MGFLFARVLYFGMASVSFDAQGAALSGGEDQAMRTLLGTINVTRLHNYRDEVLSLPTGCWAFTETSSVAGEIVGDGRFFRKHGLNYIASKECMPRTRYAKNLVHAPTFGGTAVVSSLHTRIDRFNYPQGCCEYNSVAVYLPTSGGASGTCYYAVFAPDEVIGSSTRTDER